MNELIRKAFWAFVQEKIVEHKAALKSALIDLMHKVEDPLNCFNEWSGGIFGAIADLADGDIDLTCALLNNPRMESLGYPAEDDRGCVLMGMPFIKGKTRVTPTSYVVTDESSSMCGCVFESRPAVYVAVEKGNINMLSCILDFYELKHPGKGYSCFRFGGKEIPLLHLALEKAMHASESEKNHYVEMIQFLLDEGANANTRRMNRDGYTPLGMAIDYCDQSMVKFLLDNGASLDDRPHVHSKTAIELAEKQLDFTTSDPFVDEENRENFKARVKRREQMVEFLKSIPRPTEAYVHTRKGKPHVNVLKFTSFSAAETGNVAALTELHWRGSNLDAPDKYGITPAYFAAAYGHVAVLTELHRLGANLGIPGKDGVTPLFMAAQNGHIDCVRFLISKNVDINRPWVASVATLMTPCSSDTPEMMQRMGHDISVMTGVDYDDGSSSSSSSILSFKTTTAELLTSIQTLNELMRYYIKPLSYTFLNGTTFFCLNDQCVLAEKLMEYADKTDHTEPSTISLRQLSRQGLFRIQAENRRDDFDPILIRPKNQLLIKGFSWPHQCAMKNT